MAACWAASWAGSTSPSTSISSSLAPSQARLPVDHQCRGTPPAHNHTSLQGRAGQGRAGQPPSARHGTTQATHAVLHCYLHVQGLLDHLHCIEEWHSQGGLCWDRWQHVGRAAHPPHHHSPASLAGHAGWPSPQRRPLAKRKGYPMHISTN